MRCNRTSIPAELQQALGGGDAFERLMEMRGEVFRDVPGRRTIRFQLGSKSYFIKQHYGVGWKEIFKNLLTLRLPIVSANTEVRAIRELNRIGIATTPLVAYGCRGISPARLRSFVVTEDLGQIESLETFCARWKAEKPDIRFKRRLIGAVAHLARTLHDNGLNHRDFYICHICLDKGRLARNEIYLYLIDLHRVGIRPEIRGIDRLKDMAALYFSAMDIGLTRRDYLRFLKIYHGDPLRKILFENAAFWRKVQIRAEYLYEKFQRIQMRLSR